MVNAYVSPAPSATAVSHVPVTHRGDFADLISDQLPMSTGDHFEHTTWTAVDTDHLLDLLSLLATSID